MPDLLLLDEPLAGLGLDYLSENCIMILAQPSDVNRESCIHARILLCRIPKVYESLASTLHLWIEYSSTDMIHLEVISIILNLVMFKYDTIHVEYGGHQ